MSGKRRGGSGTREEKTSSKPCLRTNGAGVRFSFVCPNSFVSEPFLRWRRPNCSILSAGLPPGSPIAIAIPSRFRLGQHLHPAPGPAPHGTSSSRATTQRRTSGRPPRKGSARPRNRPFSSSPPARAFGRLTSRMSPSHPSRTLVPPPPPPPNIKNPPRTDRPEQLESTSQGILKFPQQELRREPGGLPVLPKKVPARCEEDGGTGAEREELHRRAPLSSL